MGVIYNIADVDIIKDKHNQYRFVIQDKNSDFWKFFPWKQLNIIDTKFEGNITKVIFRAESVQTLKEFIAAKANRISYDDALQLFLNIGDQLESLEKQGMGIPNFDIKDIIVVNGNQFFYINQGQIMVISKNNKMFVTFPIKKNSFAAPSLQKLKSLPGQLPYQAGMFSLAALVVYSLTNDSDTNYEVVLESIWQTPLYWALMRCLQEDAEERVYLMI